MCIPTAFKKMLVALPSGPLSMLRQACTMQVAPGKAAVLLITAAWALALPCSGHAFAVDSL